ncbi:MAG: PAS domain S-box protein [Oxalobacteraceae bacterium]
MQTNTVIAILCTLLIAGLIAYLWLRSLRLKIALRMETLIVENAQKEEEIRIRVQTETALRESKERYERAENSTNDGIWEWNVVTGASYVSARWKQLLGYRSDEPLTANEHFFAQIHPADLSSYTEVLQAHLQQRSPYNVNLRLRCKNGEYRWFNSRGQATRNEQGQPLVMNGFISDITDNKQMEESLHDSHETLRCILDTTLDGFLHSDIRGNVLDVNLAYCHMSGYTREELLGMTMFDLNPENNNKTGENIKNIIQSGRGLYESIHRRKDGSVWNVEISVAFRDVDGGHILGFLRDITERKQTVALLEQSLAQLHRFTDHQQNIKEIERKRIAQDIHDDLGQNLLVLKMDVTTLCVRTGNTHPRLNNRAMLALDNIDSSIKSVKSIINDLRPAALKIGLHPAVEWQLKQFERMSGIACALAAIKTEVNFGLNEGKTMAVFRILQESLSNIARHAQATEVKITLNQDERGFLMVIKDNGKGLQSVDKRKKNSFGLMGIKERTHAFGGELIITSSPGNGTAISIFIATKNRMESRLH